MLSNGPMIINNSNTFAITHFPDLSVYKCNSSLGYFMSLMTVTQSKSKI